MTAIAALDMTTTHGSVRTRSRQFKPSKPFKLPNDLKELGRRMRIVRQRRGMSQTDVANEIDVAKQTISAWESGLAPPMLISLVRFAAVMNVDVSQLLSTEDLAPLPPGAVLMPASRVVPLHSIEHAGTILMDRTSKFKPLRYLATVMEHPRDAIAFVHTGAAMNPRFAEGDTVTIVPQTMAEPGSLVLACVDGRFLFRRFLPSFEGKVEGALLRSYNPDYPDVEMRAGDAILGRMLEHTSTRHS